MAFFKRKSYAVYILSVGHSRVSCHIIYAKDAGLAWLEMNDRIRDNDDSGKMMITDIKRVK